MEREREREREKERVFRTRDRDRDRDHDRARSRDIERERERERRNVPAIQLPSPPGGRRGVGGGDGRGEDYHRNKDLEFDRLGRMPIPPLLTKSSGGSGSGSGSGSVQRQNIGRRGSSTSPRYGDREIIARDREGEYGRNTDLGTGNGYPIEEEDDYRRGSRYESMTGASTAAAHGTTKDSHQTALQLAGFQPYYPSEGYDDRGILDNATPTRGYLIVHASSGGEEGRGSSRARSAGSGPSPPLSQSRTNTGRTPGGGGIPLAGLLHEDEEDSRYGYQAQAQQQRRSSPKHSKRSDESQGTERGGGKTRDREREKDRAKERDRRRDRSFSDSDVEVLQAPAIGRHPSLSNGKGNGNDSSNSNGHGANHHAGTTLHDDPLSLENIKKQFEKEKKLRAKQHAARVTEWEHRRVIMLSQLVQEERRRSSTLTAEGRMGSETAPMPKKSKSKRAPAVVDIDDELMGLAGEGGEDDRRSNADDEEIDELGSQKGNGDVPESSPPPLDPAQKALQDALAEHEAMEYRTKGMRNKDGTLRKKPGPPKGIKKGQSKREYLEESAKERLFGRREDDEASDVASGSIVVGKNKKRRLNPLTSEMGSQMGSRASSPVVKRDRGEYGEEGMDVDQAIEGILGSDSELGGRSSRRPGNTRQHSMISGDHNGKDPYDYDEPEIELRHVPPPWQPSPSGRSYPPALFTLDGREYGSPPPGEPLSNHTAFYRANAVELLQYDIWRGIATRQIPQMYRYVRDAIGNKQDNAKKVAALCARQPRRQAAREKRTLKDQQGRARKAAREATAFWRKNEREEIENRKRMEKLELERAKAAEAAKEKEMAARRLNYLLSSGEMYSKLMQKKIRTDEAMDSAGNTTPVVEEEQDSGLDDDDLDADGEADEDIDIEAEGEMTEEAVKKQAARRAKAIMQSTKRKAAAFDKQVMAERDEVLGDQADDAEDGTDKACESESIIRTTYCG